MSEQKKKPEQKKKALRASDITAVSDADLLEVDVPEWGGTIYFKVMTAEEGLRFYESFPIDAKGGLQTKGSHVRIIAYCACDEEGRSLGLKEEDLWKKSNNVLIRLAQIARVHNGLEEGPKGLKVLEFTKKDSGGTAIDALPSVLPSA